MSNEYYLAAKKLWLYSEFGWIFIKFRWNWTNQSVNQIRWMHCTHQLALAIRWFPIWMMIALWTMEVFKNLDLTDMCAAADVCRHFRPQAQNCVASPKFKNAVLNILWFINSRDSLHLGAPCTRCWQNREGLFDINYYVFQNFYVISE